MNVFLLYYKLPIDGDDLLKGIYGDLPAALLAVTTFVEGLHEHVVLFYFIEEWEVGSSAPYREYRISTVSGKLTASVSG